MMEAAYTAPPELENLKKPALLVGVVALALTLVGAFLGEESRAQFFRSYLLGYIFWLGISLGCFAILMIQHLSGGAWGIVIRRLLESATRTFPLSLVLFAPIAAGVLLHSLYLWTKPEVVTGDHVLEAKQGYLN